MSGGPGAAGRGAVAAAVPIMLLLAALEGGHALWRLFESATGLSPYGGGTLRHVAASAASFVLATLPLVLAEQLAARGRRPALRTYGLGLLGWLLAWMMGYWSVVASQHLMNLLGAAPLIRIVPAAHGPLAAAASLLASVLLFDFLYYWFHRLQHAVPLLWRLHAVHHSIRDLNAVNSYHHPLEDALRVLPIVMPIALLVQFQGPTYVPIATAFAAAWGYFIHADTRLNFGPLRAVFADGAYHRVHHSERSEDFNRNFVSFFPIFDRLFGTQRMPSAAAAERPGLPERPRGPTLRDYFLGIGPSRETAAKK